MTDLERTRAEFVASLMAFDREAEASPKADPVFPEELDLDREIRERFSEICL